ncbi:MAG: YggS family pyridoxal phosphate-dependent enzyme, partial [Epulopiscium sp.]|nr:YggS family pyridoxal phosphate-dependent enzyme [Candidatus Epulonipiscium sp.]
MIYNSIEEINKNIEEAAKKSGRSAEDIKLIAVTKTRTIEEMKEVEELGILDFGENRVQELETKHSQFTSDVNWHLIGHLQRNKVRHIIDKVKLIHSVDSLRLAKMINKEAAKKDFIVDILIQVNVSEEESKFGLAINEVTPLLKEIAGFDNIRVKGL